MDAEKAKHCVVCGCELPSYYKIPVCKNHRGAAKDFAERGLGVGAFAGGMFALVKTGGLEKLKAVVFEHLRR